MTFRVRPLRLHDAPAWKRLRSTLWPACPASDHDAEIVQTLNDPRLAAFGAFDDAAGLVGFAEFSLRDYVDEATVSPCGFLEGWYVDAAHRRRGIGRALVAGGEAWLAQLGIAQMGSDTSIANAASIAAHEALGFRETERVVRFLKTLSVLR
jgi:aminoglycoside 6'-N-acetyltransferase I